MITLFWTTHLDNFINKEFFRDAASASRRLRFLKRLPEIKLCHVSDDFGQEIKTQKEAVAMH